LSGGHGGNLGQLARQSGRAAATLLDFSANINPLGMPAAARAALHAAVDELGHYPDPDCTALRAAIGEHLGIDPARVVAGNGAEQLIWWLPRLVAAQRVVVTAPAYLDYRRAAEVWGCPVQALPLSAADGYRIDLPRVEACARAGDLVWIGQPNNPTGTLLDSAALADVVRRHPAVDWAIDEAFIDFVEGASTATAWGLPNLIVLRSMTKFFALAGLRLGYAVLAEHRAAEFARLLPDWSVNHLAAAAGTALLGDPGLADFSARTRALIGSERARLTAGLRRLGVQVYDGVANYLLLRLGDDQAPAAELAERLLVEFGLALRVCGNYAGLDDRHLRIAVRQPDDNQRLLDAFAAHKP
jgi:L-threonine-O-3-phosphate decarboxylase